MSGKNDYALIHEQFGAKQIKEAYKDEDTLTKMAREMAKKELDNYDLEKANEISEKITELNDNNVLISEIEEKSQKEIQDIITNYDKHKSEIVDLLFNSVTTVKYEIPDVVKGNFEEKFGMAN